LATVGLDLDEVDALALARALDGEPRRLVDGEHVVAVHADRGDAVALHAVGEMLDRELLPGWSRIGPVVVFADDDERHPPRRGEVDTLVERARRHPAVPDVDEPDARLAPQLE